jgi:hypothetical protein
MGYTECSLPHTIRCESVSWVVGRLIPMPAEIEYPLDVFATALS